jgi:hypothetical protein
MMKMKKSVSAFCLSLLFCASHAFAQQPAVDDRQASERCLTEIKAMYQTNPEIIALLAEARVKEGAFTLERFDEKVGSQHIAAEIAAKVEHHGRVIGQILCLTDEDRILYKHFFSAEPQ